MILLMAAAFVTYFAWPTFAGYISSAQDTASPDKVDEAIVQLGVSEGFGARLAEKALARTKLDVRYDGSYYEIDFPMGDVPEGKGVASDVVIRSYRALGVDLQELVHEDMDAHFRLYPQLWAAHGTDTSIDHRRVPNLERFLSRKGEVIPVKRIGENFEYGDVVVWRLPHGESHVGIVVPGPGRHFEKKWVVHNVGEGTRWEDSLLDYDITGQFRFGE